MFKCILLCFLGFANVQGWLFSPEKKCYDILGENICFSTKSPFFNSANRAPESPVAQRLAFVLYTPNSGPQSLDGNNPQSLTSSSFNPDKMTRVIIHGFRDNIRNSHLQTMKQELLNNDGSNVILVDWEAGATKPVLHYLQTVANTRVVGAVLGKLIQILVQVLGVSYSTFHLIGYSLGAHVAGYAGSQTQGAVGRITGLDPAGLAFANFPAEVRLDPTDAQFVDVIHTDGNDLPELDLGTLKEMRHADFYRNGGSRQPGCSTTLDIDWHLLFRGGFGAFGAIIGCNHMRVLYLFTESVNSPCPFTAYLCESWDVYNNGFCPTCNNNACRRMGLHASIATRGKFFLKTNAEGPFCKN